MHNRESENKAVSIFFIVISIFVTAFSGFYFATRLNDINAVANMDNESFAIYNQIPKTDRFRLLNTNNQQALKTELKQRYEHGPAQRKAYRLLKYDTNLHVNIDGLFCQFNHTKTGVLSSVFPCEEMDEYYTKWKTSHDVKWATGEITYDILDISSEH